MRQRFSIMRTIIFIMYILIFNAFLTYWVFSEEKDIITEPYLYEGDIHMFNGELEDAQKIYEFILKENPYSYEALWRLSRFYISRGMMAEKIKNKKKEWKEAKEYAKRAIEINPDKAEGHLYLAIALGKTALYSSPGKKVRVVWEIKREAEKAIELGPEQQKAYLTLGAWHRNVATASSLEKKMAKIFFGELPEGSLKESLKFLLKSIQLGGTDVRNYYELALTYEATGNYESAKSEFGKALAAHPVYPEDAEIKKRIKKILCKSRYN